MEILSFFFQKWLGTVRFFYDRILLAETTHIDTKPKKSILWSFKKRQTFELCIPVKTAISDIGSISVLFTCACINSFIDGFGVCAMFYLPTS